MNVKCAICNDHQGPSEDITYNVTRCGHVFHQICLLQWLERSKSCPECRSTTTENTISPIFFNILDDADSLEVKLQEKNKKINEYEIKFQELKENLINCSQQLRNRDRELEATERALIFSEHCRADLQAKKRIQSGCLSNAENEGLKKSTGRHIVDYVDLTNSPKTTKITKVVSIRRAALLWMECMEMHE